MLTARGNSAGNTGFVWVLILLATVCVRLPSLSESYWLDELHSSWTISGDFASVTEKAHSGNQTSLYYWLLWLWTHALNDAAVTARSLSVLLVTLPLLMIPLLLNRSPKLTTTTIATKSSGLSPFFSQTCLIACGLLAFESNAAFFGSETRCYAMMLGTSTMLLVVGWQMHLHRSWMPRFMFCVLSVMMLHVHLTGILVVTGSIAASTFMMIVSGSAFSRNRAYGKVSTQWRWTDTLIGLMAVALALALQANFVHAIWLRRGLWRSLGEPQGGADLWYLYPWLPLVIVPVVFLVIVGLAKRIDRFGFKATCIKEVPDSSDDPLTVSVSESRGWIIAWLSLSVLITLGVAFLLSFFGIAPLWERRYLIGVLPEICCLSAAIWVTVIHAALATRKLGRYGLPIASSLAIATVLIYQSCIQGNPWQLSRGEDWRGAIDWIQQRSGNEDEYYVAPELLETVGMGREEALSHFDHDYLRFCVLGAYALPQAEILPDFNRWAAKEAKDLIASPVRFPTDTTVWILVRKPKSALMPWCRSVSSQWSIEADAEDFGGISVLKLQKRNGGKR